MHLDSWLVAMPPSKFQTPQPRVRGAQLTSASALPIASRVFAAAIISEMVTLPTGNVTFPPGNTMRDQLAVRAAAASANPAIRSAATFVVSMRAMIVSSALTKISALTSSMTQAACTNRRSIRSIVS